MKKRIVSVLLVDDHPIILEGYKNVFTHTGSKELDFTFDTANNCDTAWEKLCKNLYDVVVLDINFPVREGSKFLSGEELGISTRRKFPEIRIIIITIMESKLKIQHLLTHIEPDGFLIKEETTAKELLLCMDKVLTSPPYYGTKVTRLLQPKINQPVLDHIDQAILYQLSLGIRTKDLPKYVSLSLRGVENRKKRLKEILGVGSKEGTKALLDKAREKGFI